MRSVKMLRLKKKREELVANLRVGCLHNVAVVVGYIVVVGSVVVVVVGIVVVVVGIVAVVVEYTEVAGYTVEGLRRWYYTAAVAELMVELLHIALLHTALLHIALLHTALLVGVICEDHVLLHPLPSPSVSFVF